MFATVRVFSETEYKAIEYVQQEKLGKKLDVKEQAPTMDCSKVALAWPK